jgi:hypothetical protein
MAKSLGISALVIAVLSLLVPLVSVYVVWIALALASAAVLSSGERTLAIAAYVICVVNVLLLSPFTWKLFELQGQRGNYTFQVVTLVLFAAPLAAMTFTASRGRREVPKT